jgi:hypothetical protein
VTADDVKCSHGATVADLDQESLFYMQSRGITRKVLAVNVFRNETQSWRYPVSQDARWLLLKSFILDLFKGHIMVASNIPKIMFFVFVKQAYSYVG